MTRRKLVVGNWKMHGTLSQAVLLTRSLQSRCVSLSASSPAPEVDVVIAPPFTALAIVAQQLNLIQISDVHLPPRNNATKSNEQRGPQLRIELAAQTMDAHDNGAFTGEISPTMLKELGVHWVILGHSERRAHCGETDHAIADKVRAALAVGITPIVAVGETAAQRQSGLARDSVVTQTRAALAALDPADVARCVVAYEPIWAIGTGINDEPEHTNETMQTIRASVAGLAHSRLLYGGSVKPGNAHDFFAMSDIDGALVGGASLSAESFCAIIAAADSAEKVQQHS